MGGGGRPIENYGKKEQKEWLDNTLPDPTAGNKEEEQKVKYVARLHSPMFTFTDVSHY